MKDPNAKQDCENCRGMGWYGDNGPGRKVNREFFRCECVRPQPESIEVEVLRLRAENDRLREELTRLLNVVGEEDFKLIEEVLSCGEVR
ncbi:MAG: hypothetical protein WC373_16645 [Smithella sp.]|jgi:hypothetical protein